MIAKEMVSFDISPLSTSDTALEALSMMDEYRVSHLPIVNEDELLGIISDDDILQLNELESPIGNHRLSLANLFVKQDQFFYDIIKLVALHKLTLIPVLDNKDRYIGVITLKDLVQKFVSIAAVNQPGGVIIFEVNERDYYASQIAQIVESNDAKILSLYVNNLPDSTKLEVILKTNKLDIRPILATFERYNYSISMSIYDHPEEADLSMRYDSLMKYLDF
jgi:acetoin utilization protein AcuB